MAATGAGAGFAGAGVAGVTDIFLTVTIGGVATGLRAGALAAAAGFFGAALRRAGDFATLVAARGVLRALVLRALALPRDAFALAAVMRVVRFFAVDLALALLREAAVLRVLLALVVFAVALLVVLAFLAMLSSSYFVGRPSAAAGDSGSRVRITVMRAAGIDRPRPQNRLQAFPVRSIAAGADPPVAQSASSIGCTTGIEVPAAICIMQPRLPAAITSGSVFSIFVILRSRNRFANSGCNKL